MRGDGGRPLDGALRDPVTAFVTPRSGGRRRSGHMLIADDELIEVSDDE